MKKIKVPKCVSTLKITALKKKDTFYCGFLIIHSFYLSLGCIYHTDDMTVLFKCKAPKE